MYYSNTQEYELGFDAFIAPDGFDRTAQPVDIYEKFKYWYPIDNKAKYIYYYSDGNYPLTLTPTADEYYKYGYTNALNQEVIVNLTTADGARTIWGSAATFGDESGYTKRWVIVYRVSTAKFNVNIVPIKSCLWIYCGNKIDTLTMYDGTYYPSGFLLKYIHYANLNTFTTTISQQFWVNQCKLIGTIIFPETVTTLGFDSFSELYQVNRCLMPNTKNVVILNDSVNGSLPNSLLELNYGASTSIPLTTTEINAYQLLQRVSVSAQNTEYSSLNNCDIIYNKTLTELKYVAPKTVRGLTIPDQLPQAQITALGTKLSTNTMQGYQLYIGTLITDLTNLYLSNKSFSTVEVGVGNTAFKVENNILYNATKTELIKTGTNNTGSLVIDNTVATIKSGAFLRCVGYTGSLTIPTTVTTIEGGSLSALNNLTGDLIFTGGQWNLSTYNHFGFANFTATSIKSIIDNDKLVNGTAGSPKYFYISKTTYDALVALSGGQASIDLAASRFINVKANYIIQDGLKLWLDASNPLSYPGTGTTWYDLSGNGNNGTMVNGVVPLSNAMSFDGVNDYVNLGNKFNIDTNPFTISMWFKLNTFTTTPTGQTPILFWKGNYNSSGYYVQLDSSSIFLSTNIPSFKINQYVSPFITNQWYNIVFAREGSILKAYLNGIIIGTSNAFQVPISNTNNFIIGAYGSTFYGNFATNDFLNYQKSLTSEEVLQNFESTRSKYGI